MKILTYPEVRCDLWHLQHQTGSQVLDILQIILHRVGQVHQVVQVDGIIFSSFELQVKRLRLTYKKLPWLENPALSGRLISIVHSHKGITSEKATCVLTRAEGEAEFLRLDLSDVLWLQFLGSFFAICHVFVPEDPLLSAGVFDHCLLTAPLYQRLQLVTTGRHSFSLFQEVLRTAAQYKLKGQSINFASKKKQFTKRHTTLWNTLMMSFLAVETTNLKQKA